MTLSLLCVRESTGVFQRVGRQGEGGVEGGWEGGVGCDREITSLTCIHQWKREGRRREKGSVQLGGGSLLCSLLTGGQRGAV